LAAGIHYQAQALNNPTGFSATGLPTGLSIDPTTGAITGLTTAVGDHNITLTASNLSGTSPAKNLILTVAPEKPLFSTSEVANPANLSGLKLWLDSRESTSIFSDTALSSLSTSSVGGWKDKSGNNNHAIQSTSANQPTITLSGIQFDGSNDGFNLTNDISEANLNLFLVLQGYGYVFANNGTDRALFLDSNQNLYWIFNSSTTFDNIAISAYSSSSSQLLEFSLNSGTAKLRLNGSVASSQGSVSGNFKIDRIGLKWDETTGQPTWTGKIMEIVAIDTNSERIGIESYLARKWGLVASLPSSHPCNENRGITVSAIGTNSANITADLIDLGGASTSLKVMFAEANGTVLETPETISSLQLWLDAADSSTIAHTSNSVSQWNDKSGNGYHASAASGQEPTTGSSTINGKNVLTWSLGKKMKRTTPSGANWQDVYVVGQWTGGATFDNVPGIFGGTTSAGSDNGVVGGNNGGAGLWISNWTNNFYLNGTSNNGSSVVSSMSSPFLISFSKNSAVSINGYQVGADRTNNGREWKGTFGEVLAFNSKLSDADRQKIEGYLANKWGINGNLPSTHPYVASMPGSFGNVNLGQTTMGLTGLTESTTYNIRVQATNSGGSRLSDLVSFTTGSTPTPPGLSVSNPTVVGTTTATTKGNLLSFDGSTNPTITSVLRNIGW
jgi:hypothetical protein